MSLRQLPNLRRAKVAVIALALAGTVAACSATNTAETSLSAKLPSEREPFSEERLVDILETVETAMKEERHSDARELLDHALMREPENAHLRLANAELILASGHIRAAHDAFANLAKNVEDPPLRTHALQGQGLTAILLDEPEDARRTLAEALAEDNNLWRAHNGMGVLADGDGNWSEAEAHYTAALEAASKKPVLHNNRGYSRLLQGRTDEAIADFEAALDEKPGFTSARENLRLAYAWKGRYAFATAGMSQKDKPRVLNNVGYVALLRGDFANAEAFLQQAVEADVRYNKPAHKNMAYLRSLEGTRNGEATTPDPRTFD